MLRAAHGTRDEAGRRDLIPLEGTVRIRTLAVSSAFFITAGLLAPALAQADAAPATTLYVNDTSSSDCSDAAGLGTSAIPFCTIQTAANVAVAGDTVVVAPGNYTAGATITASGTASAPITFVTGRAAGFGNVAIIMPSATTVGFAVNGAQYVAIRGFKVVSTIANSNTNVVIQNSSHITVDGLIVSGPTAAIDSYTSSDVTIERNQVGSSINGSDIDVSGGGSGNVVTTNIVENSAEGNGIVVEAVTDTAVTSNTVTGGCTGISAVPGEGDALNNITFENNIIELSNNAFCDGGTAISTNYSTNVTDNYNIIYSNNPGIVDYSWNDTDYTSQAAFFAGTGQGGADLMVNPELAGSDFPQEGSPAIDSADSAAPGELATDLEGAARSNDPLVSNTGAGPFTYYDRGAREIQDYFSATSSSISTDTVPVGGTLTATVTGATAWGVPVTFLYDFGDGSARVSSPSGGTASHIYSATGSYQVTFWSEINGVVSAWPFQTYSVTVVPAAPEIPVLGMTGGSTQLSVTANGTKSTDAWPITGYSFDFGDGTPPQVSATGTTSHTYAATGIYNVTMTITDAGGYTKKTAAPFRAAGLTSQCGGAHSEPYHPGLAVSPVASDSGYPCGMAGPAPSGGSQAQVTGTSGLSGSPIAWTGGALGGAILSSSGARQIQAGGTGADAAAVVEPHGCLADSGFLGLIGRPFGCFGSF